MTVPKTCTCSEVRETLYVVNDDMTQTPAIAGIIEPGKVYIVQIEHDDDCPMIADASPRARSGGTLLPLRKPAP